jgi:hypothetical protein
MIHPCMLRAQGDGPVALFDGKTLDGWIQFQNSSTAFAGDDIIDLSALASKLRRKPDPVSAFLAGQLSEPIPVESAAHPPSTGDAGPLKEAMVSDLNKIITGAPLYAPARFKNVTLRPGTQALLGYEVHGRELVQLNRLLLEDAYPSELAKSPPSGWIVKDDAMASTGTDRGVIYTVKDYSHYRLMFTMRHVYGKPDHQACVLIFGTRPQANEIPLDALGGIQFQVPNARHWDCRPGKNTAGNSEFTTIVKPNFDPRQWSRVELLVDAKRGEARMAVAQPVGSKAIEALSFKDPTAGKAGPIAWQMHNEGLFDEYKDVVLETNPQINDLISIK